MPAHNLGVLYIDDVMSYNSLTTIGISVALLVCSSALFTGSGIGRFHTCSDKKIGESVAVTHFSSCSIVVVDSLMTCPGQSGV